MTLCRFYQQGYCKFGNGCRFEHPNAGNRNQTPNRFGALGGPGGNSSGGNDGTLSKYSISAEAIEKELTTEAPQWILSAYAPGRDAPDQLFGGYPREQSFEELRLHFLQGKASGNEQQALNESQQLYQNAKEQMESAARNPAEAVRFIIEGENRHPNRHDVCKEGTQGAPFGEFLVGRQSHSSSNPFGGSGGSGGSATTTSAFGQPSTLGQRPNPFGQPAFGQPSQPTSAFGQAAQSPSPFGQPSQPSQPSQPAFGQTSQPTSAFGQPSALGAKPSPFGAPAFGQAPQPNTQSNPFGQTQPPQTQTQTAGNAFGQPSQLGQKPNPFASAAGSGPAASPFAAVSTNSAPASNPFGSSNAGQGTATQNPFASNSANQPGANTSPFGQPTQQQASSPFGQPSAPASNPFGTTNAESTSNAGGPFGQQQQQQQQQQQVSPFAAAQTSQPSGNPFGQSPSPFGQPQSTSNANPFAQNQANGTAGQANPFGSAQPHQQAPSAGGAATGNNPYATQSTKQHPPIESYSQKSMDGRLEVFKGKPVTYKDGLPGVRAFNGTWTRIWFPNGPPSFNKDTELPVGEYDEKTWAQWAKFTETGAFADGLIPELPPLRECTQWDF